MQECLADISHVKLCTDHAARFRTTDAPGSPPLYHKIWLFNISNLEAVKLGQKPILVQYRPLGHHM